MKRYIYDLGHYSAACGRMGRLQTLSVIPVVANDSMSLEMTGALRAAQLRRTMSIDSRMDLFAFFVPHRHVYKDAWQTFIKDGLNGSTLLQSVEIGPSPLYTDYVCAKSARIPLHLTAGYAQIWNEYFRVPNVSDHAADLLPEDTALQDTDDRRFGVRCARLPTDYSTGINWNGTDSYKNVPVQSGNINLIEFEKVQAQYESDETRQWFQHRYRDVLDFTYGAGQVNTDADQRPTLIMRKSEWFSGHDVEGTADANLGQLSGIQNRMINFGFPMKHFKEHGCIWIMALMRYPTIVSKEQHWFNGHANALDYKTVSGDPMVICSEPPIDYNHTDFFGAGVSVPSFDAGRRPYASWYRSHPSYVHTNFDILDGYPFIDPSKDLQENNLKGLTYDAGIADMYQTSQLENWNLVAQMALQAKRVIKPSTESIYVGTGKNK